MSIVSNASHLIGLSFIYELDLLRQMYGSILIPEAVWQEVGVAGVNQPGHDAFIKANWIERHSVKNRQLTMALLQDLDAGEAEAIALALETNADLLIIDERLGRRTAQHFGLNVVGVVGVLVEAKHRGIVRAIKPYLDQLRDIAGFRISDELYQRVLTDQMEI